MNSLQSSPSGKRILRFTAAAMALSLVLSAHAGQADTIPLTRKLAGSFLTNNKGSSIAQPPYIQVIRSREGLEYTLSRFERFKNKITQRRVNNLRKKLAGVNYKKQMLVWIFSQPMDNYKMNLKSMAFNEDRSMIEAKVSYLHKIKNFRIPPYKSIHYIVAVMPKSDLPVILQASETSSSKKKKPTRLVTVTGRLMALSDGSDLQLVPAKIKRGNKSSYYIRGAQAGPLLKYAGKVVTLRGTVSRERNSPYEWDLTIQKVVKIY